MTSVIATELIIGSFFTLIRFLIIYYILGFYIIRKLVEKREWSENSRNITKLNLCLFSIDIIGVLVLFIVIFNGQALFYILFTSAFIMGFILLHFLYYLLFIFFLFIINLIFSRFLTKKLYGKNSNESLKFIFQVLYFKFVLFFTIPIFLTLVLVFEYLVISSINCYLNSIFKLIFTIIAFTLNTILMLIILHVIVKWIDKD